MKKILVARPDFFQAADGLHGTPVGATAAAAVKRAVGTPSIMAEEQLQGSIQKQPLCSIFFSISI